MHEYYIGNWENAKQDQHQSTHNLNTNEGRQAPTEPAHTRKELLPGLPLRNWQSSLRAEQQDAIN